MNELTLEVAIKMLKLIADSHYHKSNCDENCDIEDYCISTRTMKCQDVFLAYWQNLAEKSLEEKK